MNSLYAEHAHWWPLMSPPEDYEEEAAELLPRLLDGLEGVEAPSLLELGCGGGSLASHFQGHFAMTLTDLSPEMLAVSKTVNPEAEHFAGDMRSLRLGRTFDRVFIHDAIMYAADAGSVLAVLQTAAAHCKPGGRVIVVPDYVSETFEPSTEHGGNDSDDGRAFRYLEWVWDPDPDDNTFEAVYSYVMREADGRIHTAVDHQVEGCFPYAQWLQWFEQAGIPATSALDSWNRHVFTGVPRTA
ncbi:MAG: class I SAM-dependent methyltransferase [Bryobacterales bacterium]|nr:class I SAM-dependent methyltransferase [Bryobacterales bacterium]